MATHPSDRAFTTLVSDMLTHVSTLFRAEVNLAKAEMTSKLQAMMASVAMIAVGAIVGLGGFLILLMAIVEFLVVAGLGRHWATLIVAVVTLVAGAGAAMKGIADIKSQNMTPTRTINQFGRDAQVAREQML